MTEKPKLELVPLGPFVCAHCGQKPDGDCGRCGALVCKKCWPQHKKTHEKHAVDMLHQEETCANKGCKNPPTGGQQCAYCPALLCDNWECREQHEENVHPSVGKKKKR